ncbi:elongation factor P 5-aminopentanone reductase [Virgibacillus necropolis]|uniref:3-ketoacyl-ACP reductase n=1 Tax=Virgibacillus necropolis TaxID=163877 RepID=A0A221MDD3_9BACI|nr:SDR family oxidoreductase [Virgibacillus necropolis]ASN05673.1 3-ketoacyl-ACP reductase [Virgibacillus necropolis]
MGKNVLIIGASGDIGLAIAKQLASDGYSLLLHFNKNNDGFKSIRGTINEECILTEIKADLSHADGIKYLLSQLVFPVDAIIIASGRAHHALFQDSQEDVMDEMLTLHVKAPWMIVNHVLPTMVQKKKGSIIFITSIWGNVGASNEVLYSSVKGAQNSFVKALAKEVAPSGISVNAISPGFIDTKMNHHLSEEEKQAIVDQIPMNRPGFPGEIAHTVRFLMDEKSTYIQGEIINIDGAW